MSIGSRIRSARKKAGMAQADLAAACGVRTLAVSSWERGRSTPRAEAFPLIASALSVEIDWLLTGVGRGPHSPTIAPDESPQEVSG